MEKLMPLSNYLLGIIKINPIPVNSLKEMIMLRHQGAGLDFTYNGRTKDELSAVRLADLFVKIYKFSGGNPGVALAAWLSSIRSIENENLMILPIELPRIDFISHFKSDAILVIIQLLIHKQLTIRRLTTVLGFDPDIVDQQVLFLWRMGMINKLQNDVYEINIYWYPVLTQYLVTKNYI
jgi:hypothetical protein